MLVRLRISHPILSVLAGVFVVYIGGWMRSTRDSAGVGRWSNILTGLVLAQVAAGAVTLLLHAPILLQLVHLLLADLVWISFVVLSVDALVAPAKQQPDGGQ
jgi:heme A synthase